MQPEKFRKLVRRWTIPIVIVALFGAAAGYFITKTVTPIYQVKGSILVVAGPGQTGGSGGVPLTPTQATTTAATLLTYPQMLQQVIDELHLVTNVDSLAAEVSASAQSNTELVDVTVRDPSAVRAARIANALMDAYVKQVSNQNAQRINQAGASFQAQITSVQSTLSQQQTQLVATVKARQDTTALRAAIDANTALLTQLNLSFSTFKATAAQALDAVSVAAAAPVPTKPASPSNVLNTIVGAVVGFLIALGLAGLVQFLDRGLNNADDVRDRLGVPCLGVVPKYAAVAWGQKPRGRKRRRAEEAMEAYRRLRANLLFSAPDTDLKDVVVTSARPGEGKTRIAANLAIALASSEKRVLLVDADMRKPDQHRLFRRSLEGGLSELIVQTRTDAIPSLNGVHATEYENLSLLTSGTIPPNPAELLSSKRAHLLLTSIGMQQDLIVVDTAPAGVVTDALSVAAGASATIVIVEAGKTNASQAASVITALRAVGANVVGVVLNKAPLRRRSGGYYTYGHSSYAHAQTRNGSVPLSDASRRENEGEPGLAPASPPRNHSTPGDPTQLMMGNEFEWRMPSSQS
jgi:succinoglycan biosynthesis transport protein ExoP